MQQRNVSATWAIRVENAKLVAPALSTPFVRERDSAFQMASMEQNANACQAFEAETVRLNVTVGQPVLALSEAFASWTGPVLV